MTSDKGTTAGSVTAIMMTYHDETGRAATQPTEMSGTLTDPGVTGEENVDQAVATRIVVTIVNDDHYTLDLFCTPPDGDEVGLLSESGSDGHVGEADEGDPCRGSGKALRGLEPSCGPGGRDDLPRAHVGGCSGDRGGRGDPPSLARTKFGGLELDEDRGLQELELENGRLRRAVSDLTLDKQMPTDALRGA